MYKSDMLAKIPLYTSKVKGVRNPKYYINLLDLTLMAFNLTFDID